MTVYIYRDGKFYANHKSEIKIPTNIIPKPGDAFIGYSHTYKILKTGLNKMNEKSLWCSITLNKQVNHNPRYLTGGI